MKRKIELCLLMLVTCILAFTNVKAQDLVTVNIYEEEYVSTKQNEIDLPFINEIDNKVTYDKDVNHSGITVSTEEVEILKHLKGIHLIYTNDTVWLKGKVDYPIIIATNVVIEGNVAGDAIIYAPSVVIKEGAVIDGDILISTTDLEIAGVVNGSVIASVSGKCKVTGKVQGSFRASVNEVELAEGALSGDVFLKTTTDTSEILKNYPNAIIEDIEEQEQSAELSETIITGITAVIIYTAIGFVIVRKDSNIFTKVCNKIKGNEMNVVLFGIALIIVSIILLLMLLIIGVLGMWFIAVPVAVAYVAYVIVCSMLAVFIIGTTIFEKIKYAAIKKYEDNITIKKLGLLFLIYSVLYLLTVIPFISTYVIMIYSIVAIGIVTVCLFGKKKVQDKSTNNE